MNQQPFRLLKKIIPFPPSYRANLRVLLISLAGLAVILVAEFYVEGAALHHMLDLAFLLALSAATGMLIIQERRSWNLLREFRKTVSEIAPTVTSTPPVGFGRSTEGLEKEIRMLTGRWQEYCSQCQRLHDTQMLQAEHLASLGEMAASLAHEIRNPLAGIAGAIEVITLDLPSDHPDREVLRDVRYEVQRIERVLNELLDYARPKPAHPEPVNLGEVVQRVVSMAQQHTGKKIIHFHVKTDPSLPRIRLDPQQIYEVLLNLTLNAIQAIEEEGDIALETLREKGEARAGGERVEIQVRDSGVGIPSDNLEAVFRPFFTTKTRGTGLGLSLCQRIIGEHGGTLRVESEASQGARFIIQLPLQRGFSEASATNGRPKSSSRGGVSIPSVRKPREERK